MVYVRCFGELTLEHGDRRLGPRDLGGVKEKQLFELLVIAGGRMVSKHRIADLLWGEVLPRNYTAAIESHVSVLRRHLAQGLGSGEGAIVTDPGGYHVDTPRVLVDLVDFDRLLTSAYTSANGATERLLRDAISLVRGDVFEDEPYATWAQDLRFTYRPRVIRALIDAARHPLARDDLESARGFAQRVIDMDPAVEAAYQIEMVASYRMGHQEEALRLFARCCEVLQRELAVEPLETTRELASAIRSHDDDALGRWSLDAPRPWIRRAS